MIFLRVKKTDNKSQNDERKWRVDSGIPKYSLNKIVNWYGKKQFKRARGVGTSERRRNRPL